nr:phage tail tape measure protein [Clostridium sp. Marseille-P7770]
MANNSDIIKIGFDYESGLAEFIKNYNGTMGQVQKSADGNRIEIQFDVSDKDVIKKISAIQGDFKNVKIELNGKELTQQLSSIEAIKDVLISIIKMVNDGIKIDSILNLDKTFSQVNDLKKQISDLKSSMEKMHTDNDIAEAWNEGFRVGGEELEHFRESALESTNVIFKLRKELENLQAENQRLAGSNDYFKGITDSLSQSLDEAKSEIADLQKQLETLLKASPKTNISTPKNTSPDAAGASAEDSKVSIEGEGKAADEAGKSFNKASQAKQEFVDVNKKVKQSAESSADAVKKEAEAAKQVDFTPNTEGFDEIVAKFKYLEQYRDQIEKLVKISKKNKDGSYDVSYNARLKSGTTVDLGESSTPQILKANEVAFNAKAENQEEVKARQEAVDQMRIAEANYVAEKERLLNEGKKQAEQVAEQEASERKAIVEKMQLDESDYINERERLLNEGKKQAEEVANQETIERQKAVDEMRLVEANYLDEREKLLNEGKHQAEEAAQEELKVRQNIVTQMQIDEANYLAERERLLDEGAKQAENVASQEAAEREKVLNQMRLEEADYVNERERLLKEGEQQVEEISKQEAAERQAVVEKMQIDEANYLNEREKLLNEGKLQAEQAAREEVKARQDAVDKMRLAEADYIAERERLLKEGEQQEKNISKSNTQTRLQSLRGSFGDTEIGSSRFDQMFPKIESQIEKLNKSLDKGSISIDEYKKKVDELLDKKVSNSISDSMVQAINEQKSQLKEATTEMQKVINDTANKIKTGKPVDGMRSSDYSAMMDKYKAELEELRTLQATVSKQDYVSAAQLKQFDDLRKKLKDSETSFKTLSAAEKGSTDLSREKLYSKIGEYLQKNSGMAKEFKIQLKALQKQLEDQGPNANVSDLTAQFIRLQSQIREAGQEGRSFLDVLKDKAFYGFVGQLGTYFGFNDFVRYIGEGVNTVRELDTAMTEMRKVSDESVTSLKSFQEESFNIANAVGTTALQIQNSTADWMRLGLSLEDAKEAAKDANILLNVSEFDNIEDATKSLVSMSQAYKDLDKLTIVDKLNEVGNNYAISTDELASALQRSSATLSLMGNTIDEAAALVTTANATIQDADSVAAGLRTISLRLVGTSEAEEELSAMNEEVDAFVKATNSKKQQIIKDYTAVASNQYKGFDILDDNGNYKNTYEILLGIAKVYKEIQEQDKKLGTNHAMALIEELAGKNRSNIASAILQDPKQLEEVLKSSQEANGSALEELNKQLESVDGRIQKLTNRCQEFWATVIDTDTVKTGISLLTDLVSGATALVDKLGTLPTALGALGAALSVKNVGGRKMFRLLNMPTA